MTGCLPCSFWWSGWRSSANSPLAAWPVAAPPLAGIAFTMSLFIAGQAFAAPADFAAAKIAVFGASIISATIGCAVLWTAPPPDQAESDTASASPPWAKANPSSRPESGGR